MTLPIRRESKNCRWFIFITTSLVTYLKTVIPTPLYKDRLLSANFCQKGAILRVTAEDHSVPVNVFGNCHSPEQPSALAHLLGCELWLRISSYGWGKRMTFFQKSYTKCQNLLLTSTIAITSFDYFVSSFLLGTLHTWAHLVISTKWGLVSSTLLMKERRLMEARSLDIAGEWWC